MNNSPDLSGVCTLLHWLSIFSIAEIVIISTGLGLSLSISLIARRFAASQILFVTLFTILFLQIFLYFVGNDFTRHIDCPDYYFYRPQADVHLATVAISSVLSYTLLKKMSKKKKNIELMLEDYQSL